jgi:hypothetical protein
VRPSTYSERKAKSMVLTLLTESITYVIDSGDPSVGRKDTLSFSEYP